MCQLTLRDTLSSNFLFCLTWITKHVAGKFLLVCNTQRWQRFKASTAQQFQSSWLLFVDEYTVKPIPPSQLPNSNGQERPTEVAHLHPAEKVHDTSG